MLKDNTSIHNNFRSHFVSSPNNQHIYESFDYVSLEGKKSKRQCEQKWSGRLTTLSDSCCSASSLSTSTLNSCLQDVSVQPEGSTQVTKWTLFLHELLTNIERLAAEKQVKILSSCRYKQTGILEEFVVWGSRELTEQEHLSSAAAWSIVLHCSGGRVLYRKSLWWTVHSSNSELGRHERDVIKNQLIEGKAGHQIKTKKAISTDTILILCFQMNSSSLIFVWCLCSIHWGL